MLAVLASIYSGSLMVVCMLPSGIHQRLLTSHHHMVSAPVINVLQVTALRGGISNLFLSLEEQERVTAEVYKVYPSRMKKLQNVI